jgi:hypothetical protein
MLKHMDCLGLSELEIPLLGTDSVRTLLSNWVQKKSAQPGVEPTVLNLHSHVTFQCNRPLHQIVLKVHGTI